MLKHRASDKLKMDRVIALYNEKDDKWQKCWDFLKTDFCRKMNNDYLWIRSSISLQLVFIVESQMTYELVSIGILLKSPDIRRGFGQVF